MLKAHEWKYKRCNIYFFPYFYVLIFENVQFA